MASRFRWTLTKQATDLYPEISEELTRDPLGWEDMTLRLTRDKLYHGVFTEFSLPLKFHCLGGGKEYIDNIYALEDVNAIIDVLIEIDCDSEGGYSELYTGRLNLASYSTDEEYTNCNIERSDLYSKLKSREEVSVDLESTTSIGEKTITAPSPAQLAMHSQLIFLKSSMEGQVPFTPADITLEVTNGIVIRGFVSHQLTTIISEAQDFLGWNDFNDIALNGPTASGTFINEIFEATDDDVSYPDTYTYNLHFSGTWYDRLVTSETRIDAVRSLILRYGSAHSQATSTSITLYTSGVISFSASSHSASFDTGALTGQITLNYGDKVWLEWFVSEIISTGPYLDDVVFGWDYDEARFSIEINSYVTPSEAKSFLVHEAFNQVADSIADTDYSFYSDFYGRTDSQKISYNEDGCGSTIAITNGLNIRAFDDKSIYCSLKDLFTSFNALHNIGLTIEPFDSVYGPLQDVIRVEQLSYFYDNATLILNLDGGVKVDTANDNTRYINNISIGYDKWEPEYIGGLDEPNTKHEYSTKINAIKGAYAKMCKYIASGYAIESTRRKSLEESSDWKYDNDNFVIAVNRGISCYFIQGNAIIIHKTPLTVVTAGDSMTVSTPLNSYNFIVLSTYDIFPDNLLPTIVIIVDAPDVVISEPSVFGTVTNNTESWVQTGYVSFVPDGAGAIALRFIADSISNGDSLEVSNTASNDGSRTVVLSDFINKEAPYESSLITFSEAGVQEFATDAIIYSYNTGQYFYSPELYADAFTNGSGMVALDSAYNLRLTPARMLLAHMNVITSCIQIIKGLISFVKGEGNTALETTKNDVGCQEDYNESIPYVDAALVETKSFDWDDPNVKNITPLWIPETYKFSYPLTSAELATLRANPHGYIQVTDDHGNIKKGFVLDAEYTLKTGLTKFELLRMYE